MVLAILERLGIYFLPFAIVGAAGGVIVMALILALLFLLHFTHGEDLERRKQALQQWAGAQDYTYTDVESPVPAMAFGFMELFKASVSKPTGFTPLITGHYAQLPIMVFDYRGYSKPARQIHLYDQTVVVVMSGLSMPTGVVLRPKEFRRMLDVGWPGELAEVELTGEQWEPIAAHYEVRSADSGLARTCAQAQAILPVFGDQPDLSNEFGKGAVALVWTAKSNVMLRDIRQPAATIETMIQVGHGILDRLSSTLAGSLVPEKTDA
ncbi:MAG: hypothetical protein JKY65_18500 [Planctomycetes bacterium]|nr:hypothetical protein [Planctomycetota bacterium]